MTTWKNNTTPAISQDNLNAIENKLTLLMSALYPVGAIYISTQQNNNTVSEEGKMGCPIADFFGTWIRIEGSFLLAATPNGSSGASQAAGHTGGSATNDFSNTLHYGVKNIFGLAYQDQQLVATGYGDRYIVGKARPSGTSDDESAYPHLANLNNMPPYLAVYMWERTA